MLVLPISQCQFIAAVVGMLPKMPTKPTFPELSGVDNMPIMSPTEVDVVKNCCAKGVLVVPLLTCVPPSYICKLMPAMIKS